MMAILALLALIFSFRKNKSPLWVSFSGAASILFLSLDLVLNGREWAGLLMAFVAVGTVLSALLSSVLERNKMGWIDNQKPKWSSQEKTLFSFVFVLLLAALLPFLVTKQFVRFIEFKPGVFILGLIGVLASGILLRRRSPWRSF